MIRYEREKILACVASVNAIGDVDDASGRAQIARPHDSLPSRRCRKLVGKQSLPGDARPLATESHTSFREARAPSGSNLAPSGYSCVPALY
jgi:hypothetical protein